MKKSGFILGVVLAGVLVFGLVGMSFGQDIFVKDEVRAVERSKSAPGEILVKFKPGVTREVIAAINSKHGTSEMSTSRFGGFKRLRIPKRKTVAEMVEIYKKNPNVEYAEPNFIAQAFWVPNDELYPYQWHFDNDEYGGIHMEAAWELAAGDSGVIVAVIDSGVAYEDWEEFVDRPGRGQDYWITYQQAPDLAGTSFVPGYDFVNDDAHPNDDDGHGTHVTGTIAQSTNNALGVAGIAFNTSIMPVKVLNSNGDGTYADIADGIYFAAQNGAHIINMSLGGDSPSITLENALAYAYDQGVTIICASGNDGADSVSYPAAYDAYCIAVGATRYDEAVAYYSNQGASLDLTAPGGDLNVDQNGDGYGDGVLQQTFGDSPTDWGYWFYQGTSMAAPHVSGVAALLIAANVATTPDEIREALQSTAEDKSAPGWDPAYGWGILNAAAALQYSFVPNTAPVAAFTGPASGEEDAAVAFDGSGSYDPDGDPLTYRWDFGDGSTGAGVSPDHAYAAGGEYTVTLIVNDGKADSLPAESVITIAEINDPPVADAGPDQTVQVGQTITFDAGAGSYDIDDGIAFYEWNFGDGARAAGETAAHAYSAAGIYTVTLTVTDFYGDIDTDEAIITVTEESTLVARVAGIDLTLSTRTAGKNRFTKAVAEVTVTDGSDNPVEGATVYGSWSGAVSGAVSGITDSNGRAVLVSPEIKNAKSGTTFIFTVDDVSKAGWTYDPGQNAETAESISVQ